jgi:hypothetical protein
VIGDAGAAAVNEPHSRSMPVLRVLACESLRWRRRLGRVRSSRLPVGRRAVEVGLGLGGAFGLLRRVDGDA